jgi:hypothetical protein
MDRLGWRASRRNLVIGSKPGIRDRTAHRELCPSDPITGKIDVSRITRVIPTGQIPRCGEDAGFSAPS